MEGIVAQMGTFKSHYRQCAPFVEKLLMTLLELYEMMRQCLEEQHISFHLTHADYARELKRALRGEVTHRLCEPEPRTVHRPRCIRARSVLATVLPPH